MLLVHGNRLANRGRRCGVGVIVVGTRPESRTWRSANSLARFPAQAIEAAETRAGTAPTRSGARRFHPAGTLAGFPLKELAPIIEKVAITGISGILEYVEFR